MNPIAISAGNIEIYYSGIIIALAIAAASALSCALYSPYAGNRRALWVMLPFALLFSLIFSRFIHWYCHAEQYTSLFGALTDYSGGSYVLPGAIFGIWLAAFLACKLGFTDSTASLLDAFAPGAALGVALIRLSALFNNSCRAKISVTNPALQRLPLAAPVYTNSGSDYRFATFFVQFILMFVIFIVLFCFCCNTGKKQMKRGVPANGHAARLFLLLYSAVELIMDSTRYDSSYMHFNGFVSIVQMLAAISILGLLIYYSLWSIRVNGLLFYHPLLWVGWLVTLAGVGFSEYLVQRHGDWYIKCYSAMAFSIILMCAIIIGLYKTCRNIDPDEA